MAKKRKPGRPPTKEGARQNRVQVLLHDNEKERIEIAAGGNSLSEFLRVAGLKEADLSKNSKPRK